MDDAGFIIGSYALTFGAVLLYGWKVMRRSRKLADQIPDEDKYWL